MLFGHYTLKRMGMDWRGGGVIVGCFSDLEDKSYRISVRVELWC